MKIVVCDSYYESFEQERKLAESIGAEFFKYDCKTEEDVISVASDCDVLICQFAPITKKVIDSLKFCKAIIRYAIGYDNIDWKYAETKGIYVCNCPDYCIDEVSNHAIAMIMDCARKLTLLAGKVKQGNGQYTQIKPLYRIAGKTLGIVGFGRIASAVARKMKGFEVDIISYDPFVPSEVIENAGVESVSFEELLERSDFITVHCPLSEKTRHLFGSKEFDRMKETCIFVNTSRGAVVDEKALIEALEGRKIGMAGIDVTETEPLSVTSKLLSLDNAVVTSHMAWYSEEAIADLQKKVGEEAVRVLKEGIPLHPINNPKKGK